MAEIVKKRAKPPESGRKKGVTNKTTAELKAALAAFASRHVDEMSKWLLEVEDPAKRIDLTLRAMEYALPKLARTEQVGEDGGPIKQQTQIIVKFGDDD
jgi:hypothetical protein